jgi:hypothetical protein
MPWHRLGTVSVTLNSSTVTGVGTGFAANARIGDAFIGPDGRQYELGNVASDTVISIIPAYQGPSVSGAAYAIVPVQGYQKGLADQVRDWVNTYGAKMAALGTTGNYDVLPVNKGGTGITDLSSFIQGLLNDADAPAARATLGAAKSGANNDITALSGLTTALTVNMGGTGGNTPALARTGLELNLFGIGGQAVKQFASVDMDTITENGTFGFSTPSANGPGFSYGTVTVEARSSTEMSQLAVSVTSDQMAIRRKANGPWEPWVQYLNTGNMVGTVSQVGGVPNGAVLQSSTNASGTWTKYADGTFTCRRRISITTAINTPINGGYYSGSVVPAQSYPGSFIAMPDFTSVQMTTDSSTTGWIGGRNSGTVDFWAGCYLMELFPRPAQTYNIEYFAVGRWY